MENLETVTWEQLEKRYKIRFKLKNGEFRPVNEWLDDIYLLMSYNDANHLLMVIMRNGESLFKDILFHRV